MTRQAGQRPVIPAARLADVDPELVRRVAASTGLSAGEAARMAAYVLAWKRVPVQKSVRRWHAQHRRYGKKSREIFAPGRGDLEVPAAPAADQAGGGVDQR